VRNEAEYVEFAEASVERLRSTAFLMCRDWHLAQDLTQITLTKVYLAWARVSRAGNVDAYARKVLMRAYLDHVRRRSSGEVVTATLPESARDDAQDLRLTLLDALALLPPRDRAIVVLRYWEDYSVERVAEVLGVRVSVVTTQTTRSLAKLRRLLSPDQVELFA
jgi:RNA polymerase sigma-70 factor (sigma-E family)